jgi:glycosyltransferase involved in cell wall biosynthesis
MVFNIKHLTNYMKIVVLGTRGIPHIQGGVETHCEELYPRLVKLGCKVTLITRRTYADTTILEYRGVKLHHLYNPHHKSLEAIVHTFLGVLYARSQSPDILHIHAIGPSLLVPLAKLLGLKVVVTNHGPDYDRQKWGKIAKIILRLGEKLGSKFADKIIVISNTIKEIVESNYHRKDCVLIPNGVNIPPKCTSTAYINSLGLQKDKYIIAVGRFVPEKGFHDLIEAYKQLDNREYKLVLVGDADHETEYSRNLKETAYQHGVCLTGFLKGEKLNEVFSHARLFAMPSYHEGLPIALLEALSYGVDLLVSDILANQEIPLNKEDYFSVGDISNLSEQLSGKLRLPSKNHSNKSTILKKYNWDDVSSATFALYKNT